MTKSKLYKITAWRDNAVKIVLTQGEGSNADNPSYNKTIQFRLTESGDQLLTVPNSAEIVLAIVKPDHSTDLISGYLLDGSDSDIAFDVKNTITSIAGIVRGEIRIITAQSVVKFYGVNFNIYGSVNDDGAIQSEQFDALVQALQKVIAVTGDGEVANMDSVIAHGGTNPVASGLVYDYLVSNYYTKTESDNKFQTIANKTQTIDSNRQTTTQNATQYPSVAAVKEFLYANFLTEDEIDELLENVYSKSESDNKYALKSNTYTKSEINAIQTENDKRFALHMSVAFDDNGIPVKFVDRNSLSAGDFIGDTITTAFIGSNVYLIQSGTFVGCHNLTDVYVDKKQSAITIQEGALPNGATVHYVDGFNYGELIIAAVKYLNTIKANAADVYTKTETDNIITSVVPVEFTVTLMSNEWTLDGKQYIDLPSGIVIGENTRIIDVECLNENDLSNAWGGESISIYINTEANTNEKIYALAVADDDSVPNINVNIKIILSEVNVIESVPQ